MSKLRELVIVAYIYIDRSKFNPLNVGLTDVTHFLDFFTFLTLRLAKLLLTVVDKYVAHPVWTRNTQRYPCCLVTTTTIPAQHKGNCVDTNAFAHYSLLSHKFTHMQMLITESLLLWRAGEQVDAPPIKGSFIKSKREIQPIHPMSWIIIFWSFEKVSKANWETSTLYSPTGIKTISSQPGHHQDAATATCEMYSSHALHVPLTFPAVTGLLHCEKAQWTFWSVQSRNSKSRV